MKISKVKNFSLPFIICTLLFFSCSSSSGADEKKHSDSLTAQHDTLGELLDQRSFGITAEGDTINIKDKNGLKQGLWITNTGVMLSNGGVKKDSVYYKDGQVQKK